MQYDEYINSDIALLPNVSVTNDNNKVHYNPIPNYLKFTAQQDNSTIALNSANNPDVKYSLNGGVWTQWDYSAITLNTGDTVRMKGNNSNGFSTSRSNYNKFQMTGKISASGNIMSLLYEDDFEKKLTIPGENCFYRIFYGCTSLTTAPELPAITLASNCYDNMFRGCTSLTTAPELPATTLANYCYRSIFFGCTALTTAPELPATTLANNCYQSMFSGCTSLTTAPELPATTLPDSCYYNMFYGCTSLTTAPELPATTLANSCYQYMFCNCTSLTTAPKLPATTLANSCYQDMFCNCTSLTTAPKLPATTLAESCYDSMFYGCTSLTTAPKLPATTLAESCYDSMFSGCTGLTTAPKLPATTLAERCYKYMFSGCTSLNSITCLATDISASDCTTNWVSGVASSGTFTKAESMTSWTNDVNGIPGGWTVEDKQEIQRLIIYVDDFNFLEELDDFIKDPESMGSNGYYLTNNTISYQGGVYYVWNSIDDTSTPYGTLLTTTNDFNTLYSESLEQNKTNHFNSFMSRANSDQTVLYDGWSEKSILLIKIEVVNGQTIIWVDDFDIGDEIDYPYECGANMYEYTGETMTYQGVSYYVWNMVEGVDGAYDNLINKLLTTTVDYDTLYSQSLEDNVGNTFDALFCRMSDDNDEVYDDTSTQYLVKVVMATQRL